MHRPLRILHVILAVRPTNGQYNEHCLPLRHIRDISICTYFKSELAPPPEIALFDGDNTVRGFFRALRAALYEREYDVIHVHTPHAGVLLLAGLFLFGRFRRLKPSTVHTIQNSWPNFKLRNQLLHIPSFPLFQQLVFCSHASYESFPALLKWMGGNRMRVVQNAVDIDRIDRITTQIQAPDTDMFTIATVGLIKMKNPFTVLQAFRRCHYESSRLVYIGEGNLRLSLEREVRKSDLHEQVEMTGLVHRDEVFEHFVRADLFVSASWGEGFPVAVLEAMACSRPVLLSDIPPHREIAEGIDFIPLVEPHDVAAFAREIKRFAEMPGAKRAAIGQECRKLVEERFSLAAMHAGLAEVYAQITGKQVGSPFEPARSASLD